MSWHTKSIAQQISALDSGTTSPEKLARYYLERVDSFSNLNAFIDIDKNVTLQQSKADYSNTPLKGLPLGYKDLFCTTELQTRCASKILTGYQSPFDATIIANLKKDGAVTLGKINMDEFAMGSSNENSIYGPCLNPWDETRVPGGSSGGSAAAVAAGLCPAATASDTGGSIRQPAAFCGVTGIKPTYGSCSRYGMVAFASSFDQAGVIARSAEDCATVLSSMISFDEKDSTSSKHPNKDLTTPLNASLNGVRIGLPKEFFAHDLPNDLRTRIDDAIKQYEQLGATIVDINLPNTHLSIPAYYVLTMAEVSSNLSRFDGVRYGYRAEQYEDLTDMYEKTRSEGLGEEAQRRIMMGAYVLSESTFDAYFVKAQKLRRLIADDFAAAFKQCDVIAGPTTPSTAFKIGEKTSDPVAMYLEDIFTVPVNLAGLPALSHPVGFDDQNLPVGLQLIGNTFDEGRILNLAHQYQLNTNWHNEYQETYQWDSGK